jgi:hypothetical protein
MQEMIKVYLGDTLITEVPKVNEANVRALYAGTENERRLRITTAQMELQQAEARKIALERLEQSRKQTAKENPAIKTA